MENAIMVTLVNVHQEHMTGKRLFTATDFMLFQLFRLRFSMLTILNIKLFHSSVTTRKLFSDQMCHCIMLCCNVINEVQSI